MCLKCFDMHGYALGWFRHPTCRKSQFCSTGNPKSFAKETCGIPGLTNVRHEEIDWLTEIEDEVKIA